MTAHWVSVAYRVSKEARSDAGVDLEAYLIDATTERLRREGHTPLPDGRVDWIDPGLSIYEDDPPNTLIAKVRVLVAD